MAGLFFDYDGSSFVTPITDPFAINANRIVLMRVNDIDPAEALATDTHA